MERRWKYDFYLPDYNIAIEYDGIQHFEHVPIFYKTDDCLKNAQIRDLEKTQYCIDRKISIMRISYLYFDDINVCMEEALSVLAEKKYTGYFAGEYQEHRSLFVTVIIEQN